MTTHKPYIGRQEGIGFGIEAVPGIPVAPQAFARWLDQGLAPKTTIIENESAQGSVNVVNDSAVTQKWAEGPFGGKLTAEVMGFILLGYYGTVTSAAPVGGKTAHTFSTNQSSTPTTLTIAKVTPASSKRHSYGTLDNFEISGEAGGWVQMTTALKARIGVVSTDDPSVIPNEGEFTSKHVSVKIAEHGTPIATAPKIKARSFKVASERPSTAEFPLGTDEEVEFDRGSQKATGELGVRYDRSDYEDGFLAHKRYTVEITISNGEESLVITGKKVRIAELETSNDKEEIVAQTLSLSAQEDENGELWVPVLTNSRAAYIAA